MNENEVTLVGMKPALFVRTLTDAEPQALEKELRSADAFVLLLPAPVGQRPPGV